MIGRLNDLRRIELTSPLSSLRDAFLAVSRVTFVEGPRAVHRRELRGALGLVLLRKPAILCIEKDLLVFELQVGRTVPEDSRSLLLFIGFALDGLDVFGLTQTLVHH